MNVTRINEARCPRCGRGELSGYVYPACWVYVQQANVSWGRAHRLLCRGPWADYLCDECERVA